MCHPCSRRPSLSPMSGRDRPTRSRAVITCRPCARSCLECCYFVAGPVRAAAAEGRITALRRWSCAPAPSFTTRRISFCMSRCRPAIRWQPSMSRRTQRALWRASTLGHFRRLLRSCRRAMSFWSVATILRWGRSSRSAEPAHPRALSSPAAGAGAWAARGAGASLGPDLGEHAGALGRAGLRCRERVVQTLTTGLSPRALRIVPDPRSPREDELLLVSNFLEHSLDVLALARWPDRRAGAADSHRGPGAGSAAAAWPTKDAAPPDA